MHRRRFVKTGLAATAALGVVPHPDPAAAAQPPAPGRAVYELRTYELRNDLAVARTLAYFERELVPALRRAGAGPVGVFTPESGLPQPSVVLLVPHGAFAEVGAAAERLAGDAAFRAATDAWERGPGLPYVRYEAALYRAFAGHPRLEAPPARAGRPPRLFELRTYEAPNDAGLRAKVAMFDQEEIRIFRDSGFAPVMFGEAVAGTRLPHLTYLVAFDDMAARTAAWARFAASPDWQRVRVRPGWSDAEAVSTIRAAFLRPAAFSDVR